MDLITLSELFRSLSSNTKRELEVAEDRLQALYTNSEGFFSATARIVQNNDFDFDSRLAAAVFLKNKVDTVFKAHNPGISFSLPPIWSMELMTVKGVLLSRFDESNDLLSTQIALIISRIARVEGPQKWTELLPTLSEKIFNFPADSLVHYRALFILYHVMKAFASKRLPPDRVVYRELCHKMFNSLVAVWKLHLDALLQNTSPSHDLSCLLCVKILRYMVNHGFEGDYRVFDVQGFLNELPIQCKQILGSALYSGGQHPQIQNMTKIVASVLKMVIEFQSEYPSDFVPYMHLWMDFCYYAAFNDQIYNLNIPIMKLRSILLLIVAIEYSHNAKANSEIGRDDIETGKNYFRGEKVQKACLNLMNHYLMLNEEDLNCWDEEPESFALVFDSHDWRENLTAASKKLFIRLVHDYWEDIKTSLSVWLIDQLSRPIRLENCDLKAILEKDTVINALGLIADELYDEIDFDQLFNNYFAPFLATQSDNSLWSNVLRRRILWVCGVWVSVKFVKSPRDHLYGALLFNMGQNFNIVVRISACNAFRSAIDDFDFDVEDLRPFIATSIGLLINLLKICSEVDAKALVLSTLLLLIGRLGSEVKAYVEPVLNEVSQLWFSGDIFLRNPALSIFTAIVKILKSDSIKICHGLCQILPSTISSKDDADVCLTEDGLELLQVLIENVAAPFPKDLTDLANLLPDLMASQTEYLKTVCQIMGAYLTAKMPEFLDNFAKFISKCFEIMDGVISEAKIAFLKTFIIFVKCYGHVAFPHGYIASYVSPIVQWCFHITQSRKINLQMVAEASTILALLAVHNINIIVEHMNGTVAERKTAMLTSWIEHFHLGTHSAYTKKLYALAILPWLSIPERFIVSLFPKMMHTLFQVVPPDDSLCSPDDYYNYEDQESISENDQRLRLMMREDPVFTSSLPDEICRSYRHFKSYWLSQGPEFERLWWDDVEAEINRDLSKFNLAL